MHTEAQLRDMPCQHQVAALAPADIAGLLGALSGWTQEGERIVKPFAFKDFHATIAFVNAIADLANAQDHHPELVVTYNRCVVKFDTHSVNQGRGGLSINDFICAARVDALQPRAATGPG